MSYILEGPETVSSGQEFTVDWVITSNADLCTYGAAIDFDEEVLAAPAVSINEDWLGPKFFVLASVENDVAIAVVSDFTGSKFLKAGSERQVASLKFTAVAKEPTATEIAFVDSVQRAEVARDGNVSFVSFRNVVSTTTIDEVDPQGVPITALIEPGAKMNLPLKVREPATFTRGDANHDSVVNLSDAVRIIGYLFLGAKAPECPDAADADDSGHLSITDPICLLDFLFRGGSDLPDPGAYKNGVDPTADSLSCGE